MSNPNFSQDFDNSLQRLENLNDIVNKAIEGRTNFSQLVISKLQEISERINNLKTGINQLLEKISGLEAEVEGHGNSINTNEAQINMLTAQVQQLESQIQELTQEKEECEQEKTKLQSENAQLSQEKEALVGEKSRLEAEVERLNDLIKGHGGKEAESAQALAEQKAQYEAQITQLNQQIADKNAEIAQLQQQITEKNAEIAQLQQEITEHESTHVEKDQAMAELTSENNNLKKQNEDLINRIIRATEAINKAMDKLEELNNVTVSKQNYDAVQQKITEIEASIENISRSMQGQPASPSTSETVESETTSSAIPSNQPIELANGFNGTYGELINELNAKSKQQSKPNKYSEALDTIKNAQSIDEINTAMIGITYKNGKIMGGKTRKTKKIHRTKKMYKTHKTKKIHRIKKTHKTKKGGKGKTRKQKGGYVYGKKTKSSRPSSRT